MWLSNFKLVLEDRMIERGAVRIDGEHIAEIRDTPVEDGQIDGNGKLLLPGFIDIHGDMIEKDVEPRPNVHMPLALGVYDLDRKLASCGITTAYAALSFQPVVYGKSRSVEHTTAMIEALTAMRGELLVDHRIHGRFEVTFPDALTTVDRLLDAGMLDLISLMDHTPGQGQYRDIERHVAYLAKERGIDQAGAAELVRQRMSENADLGGSMQVVSDLAGLARRRALPLASHDDDTVEKVGLMHELGATISEFPITLEAATEAKRRGLLTVMGAPNALRGLSYSGNLSARQAHAEGLLDILVSDYHPSAMLPSLFALAELTKGGLPAAVALASSNPARVMGLDDRGRIETGLRADLVIAENGAMPRPRATLRNGRTIWSDGSIAGLQ